MLAAPLAPAVRGVDVLLREAAKDLCPVHHFTARSFLNPDGHYWVDCVMGQGLPRSCEI